MHLVNLHVLGHQPQRSIFTDVFGEGPIPVDTLYTEPESLFADPLHAPASGSNLMTTGGLVETDSESLDRSRPCKADPAHTAKATVTNAMSRTYTFYLAALVGAICVFFIVHAFFLGHFFVHSRTVRLDLMQGFLIGVGLAFVTAQAHARIKATKVNGWITMFGLGVPGNGMLLRAAHAQYFPGSAPAPSRSIRSTRSPKRFLRIPSTYPPRPQNWRLLA
jgi:hypothetical protein